MNPKPREEAARYSELDYDNRRIVDSLMESGLIERRGDCLYLTEKGETLVKPGMTEESESEHERG